MKSVELCLLVILCCFVFGSMVGAKNNRTRTVTLSLTLNRNNTNQSTAKPVVRRKHNTTTMTFSASFSNTTNATKLRQRRRTMTATQTYRFANVTAPVNVTVPPLTDNDLLNPKYSFYVVSVFQFVTSTFNVDNFRSLVAPAFLDEGWSKRTVLLEYCGINPTSGSLPSSWQTQACYGSTALISGDWTLIRFTVLDYNISRLQMSALKPSLLTYAILAYTTPATAKVPGSSSGKGKTAITIIIIIFIIALVVLTTYLVVKWFRNRKSDSAAKGQAYNTRAGGEVEMGPGVPQRTWQSGSGANVGPSGGAPPPPGQDLEVSYQ